MNRAERRRMERETKEEIENQKSLTEWFNSFTPAQRKFHKNMISAIVDEVQEETEKILDSCYISAILQETDLSLDICKDIALLANLNMLETRKYLEDKGEEYFMSIENEGIRKEIREKAKEIFNRDPKISVPKAIKELKESFDFPNKDLNILVAEAREEIKLEEKSIAEGELVQVKGNELINPNYIGVDLAVKNEDSNSLIAQYPKNLKIKSIEIEGTDGRVYLKSQEGVKIGPEIYKEVREVEQAIELLEGDTSNKKDNIISQIHELNKQLNELESNKIKELVKYEEIKAVFAM